MSPFLLDVNVLIALLWPDHTSHARVQRWFQQNASQGWATCAITQAGFLRVVSNPAFSSRALSSKDAIEVLRGSLRHPTHHFWTEDLGTAEALAYLDRTLLGHRQVTDAYLLGLAIHKKGRLATLDSAMRSLLPEDPARKAVVTVL